MQERSEVWRKKARSYERISPSHLQDIQNLSEENEEQTKPANDEGGNSQLSLFARWPNTSHIHFHSAFPTSFNILLRKGIHTNLDMLYSVNNMAYQYKYVAFC